MKPAAFGGVLLSRRTATRTTSAGRGRAPAVQQNNGYEQTDQRRARSEQEEDREECEKGRVCHGKRRSKRRAASAGRLPGQNTHRGSSLEEGVVLT